MASPLLLLLLTATSNVNPSLGYYLSLNHLEWRNASAFCRSHCKSELASIHSVSQHLAALAAIATSPYVSEDVWIGLNDIGASDEWRWSDGSASDFGLLADSNGLVLRSQFPWRSGEPDVADSDDAVAIETLTTQWSDREQFANSHVLCAACDGRPGLSKFVAINGYRTQREAELLCRSGLGTSLAAVHSARDFGEAQAACRGVTDGRGCWLGLSDARMRRQFWWSDGSEWRFGRSLGVWPWLDAQPGAVDEDACVQMDPPHYLWNDDHCNATARTLCNAPSLVCEGHAPLWLDISGDASPAFAATPPCSLTLSAETSSAPTRLVMAQRRWRNGQEALVMDMLFSAEARDADGSGSAGLTLHLDSNCAAYYYVGIWPAHALVFIGRFAAAHWTLLEMAPVDRDAAFELYALRVEHQPRGNIFQVFVDEVLLISIADEDAQFEFEAELSGFVGLRSVNASVRVLSLFVSGSVFDFPHEDALRQSCLNISTGEPTADPSGAPTMAPPTPTQARDAEERESREPSRAPTMGVASTASTSAAGVADGDGDGDDSQAVVTGTSISSQTLLWLIGIPAGAIMICLVLSCVVNLYFCKSEFVEPEYSDDDEGDDSCQLEDGIDSDTQELDTEDYDI